MGRGGTVGITTVTVGRATVTVGRITVTVGKLTVSVGKGVMGTIVGGTIVGSGRVGSGMVGGTMGVRVGSGVLGTWVFGTGVFGTSVGTIGTPIVKVGSGGTRVNIGRGVREGVGGTGVMVRGGLVALGTRVSVGRGVRGTSVHWTGMFVAVGNTRVLVARLVAVGGTGLGVFVAGRTVGD